MTIKDIYMNTNSLTIGYIWRVTKYSMLILISTLR